MLCNLHCRPHWLAVGLTVYSKEFYKRGLFVWKHLLLLSAYSTTYRIAWFPVPSPPLHSWNGLFLPIWGLVPGYLKGLKTQPCEQSTVSNPLTSWINMAYCDGTRYCMGFQAATLEACDMLTMPLHHFLAENWSLVQFSQYLLWKQ